MSEPSWYYDKDRVKNTVVNGGHRQAIGGMWDEIGKLQLDFLINQGLLPHHKILDVGCGCLRGGLHFVNYLNSGNYFGIDLNQSLLDAGIEEVRNANLAAKLPIQNLLQTNDFDAIALNAKFEFALSISVFTHLPLNTIRICMEMLTQVISEGGSYYSSIFLIPEEHLTYKTVTHTPGNITTYGDADPYHYRISDIEHILKGLPWILEVIGDFSHPRNQKMLRFIKI